MAWLELRHRLRPSSPLQLTSCDWKFELRGMSLFVSGVLEIRNPHSRMEIFVPNLRVKPSLLGKTDISRLTMSTLVKADHPDEETRADDYWQAYIVKPSKTTKAKVNIEIRGESPLEKVDSLWIDVYWVNYGPFGRLNRQHGFVVPFHRPKPLSNTEAMFLNGNGYSLLPLRTHLLGTLDNPIQVLQTYSGKLLKPGDILTIGETPVAITQNRYIHPNEVHPEMVAHFTCRLFHPTSSLATACGMQTLIDCVGPTRVIISCLGGFIMKLIKIDGGFYRLAGKQARLIDDITGTTPPYDQTIVLGPEEPYSLCCSAAFQLGVHVAIVDVNDLGGVKIIASSSGCDESLLKRALKSNPAGNANQRTPLVLVRPCEVL